MLLINNSVNSVALNSSSFLLLPQLKSLCQQFECQMTETDGSSVTQLKVVVFFCAYCLHVYVRAACSNYNSGYESRQMCAFMLHNCRFSEQVLNLHLGF